MLKLPANIVGVNENGKEQRQAEEDAVVWRVEPAMVRKILFSLTLHDNSNLTTDLHVFLTHSFNFQGTLKSGKSVSISVFFSPSFPLQYFPLTASHSISQASHSTLTALQTMDSIAQHGHPITSLFRYDFPLSLFLEGEAADKPYLEVRKTYF
jgi:hypothetical protein